MNRGEAPTISMDRVALDLVGLDSKGDPHEQIKTLFRKLQAHDFLPDPMAHEAMLTLSGQTLSPNSPLVQETNRRRERNLVEAVEQFADEFFLIPPADRLERWNELAEACKGKIWLIGRLLGLKSGLQIDTRSFVEASPVVRRLLEDLLELFPLRPSSHGIESRARASRFRNDPSVTATERARALKTVRRRYSAIAPLSRGHLESLERPSKPQETQGWWARLVRIINVKFEEQPQLLVLMIGCLMATLLLLGWIARPDPRSQPSPVRRQKTATTPPKTATPASSPGQFNRFTPTVVIREEFAARIRKELNRIGKKLDDDRLNAVLDALPIEDLPKIGGLSTIAIRGFWTRRIHSRFVNCLKDALKATDLKLSEAELDDFAARCIPRPTDDSDPDRNELP